MRRVFQIGALYPALSVLAYCLSFGSVSAQEEVPPPVGTPASSEPPTNRFEVCSLYDETALATARTRAGFAADEECSCEKTEEVCDQNWRGAEKHTYICECTRQSCDATTCAMNVVIATTNASVECRRTSCSCAETEVVCGENFLGERLEYTCSCP